METSTPAAPAAATEAPASASSEGQESHEGREPSEPSEPKKQKAPSFRKYKVGNEEIALSDEDIARDYSKWKGSDKAFREAARMKKEADEFMEALKEDPERILSDKKIPIDKRKLAEKWLLEEIEREMNPEDPRDRKISEIEKKLREYEEKEAEAERSREEGERERLKEARKAEISKTLSEAMQRTHLSADPDSAAAVLREMALYMRAARERGEDVSPDELVEHIHNQRFRQFYNLAGRFEGPELVEFLGEEIVNKIRKHDLERLRAARGQKAESPREERWAERPSEKPVKRMDPMAAREHANKILGL